MLKRTLGATGLEVSVIGFGGIPIQRISKEEAKAMILEAENQGINFIDTARGYTVSEAFIGEALEGRRDKWIVATKTMAKTYKAMKEDIESSLRDLKMDYIDLYQCHNISKIDQYETLMAEDGGLKALIEAKAEGKIGHIGFTSHSADILMMAIESGAFETIQFPFNPIEQQGVKAFKRAIEKNMGTIVMKPVAGGAFTNPALSLKYILNQDFITVAIPGMDQIEQVLENAAVGNHLTPLTDDEKLVIDEVVNELGTEFCRRCGYCLPCPQNIDIPLQFIFHGYFTRYNMPEWAKGRFEKLEYSAADCDECGLCETRCPYDLPIRKMLKDVDRTFNG